jgi:hypothetical protein
MGLLKSPLYPYVSTGQNPYTAEIKAARELYVQEIDNTEGWEGTLIYYDAAVASSTCDHSVID